VLRVGHIPYLNAAPFYATLATADDVTLRQVTPRQLGRLAQQGELDAGPMAVTDYLRLHERFEPIGDFGIAVRTAAQSVLLFSKVPRLNLHGRVVCSTEETSTSFLLLRLILEARYQLQPDKYLHTEHLNGGDALLLIGDKALQQQTTVTTWLPFVTDLGTEWWQWMLLPFVFAVWVIRRDLPSHEKEPFMRLMQASLAEGLRTSSAIAARSAASMGLAPSQLESYVSNFTYTLGPQEHAGLSRFRALLVERELL